MKYLVWNHGPTRNFPCNGVNITINKGAGITVDDEKIKKNIALYPMVEITDISPTIAENIIEIKPKRKYKKRKKTRKNKIRKIKKEV